MKWSFSECLLCCLQSSIFYWFTLKLWRHFICFFWFHDENKKAPINHQISHRSSLRSRFTFSLSHYSKIQLFAPTFSSLFAPRNTWSGPFTAAEHWINLTSPQVWPSDRSPAFCTVSCVFISLQTTELLGGCLELLWPLFIWGHDLSLLLLHININFIQLINISAGKLPQYDSSLQLLAIK